MFDSILEYFHPEVQREWDEFYPKNDRAIAKFLCHSNSFPCYKNPIDHYANRHEVFENMPKKYHGVKVRDILNTAPYWLKKFFLANKSFIIEA